MTIVTLYTNLGDDGIIHVIPCSVRADGEKPLFMCSIDGKERSNHSDNATTLTKAVLKSISAKFTGNMTGKKFFGLQIF